MCERLVIIRRHYTHYVCLRASVMRVINLHNNIRTSAVNLVDTNDASSSVNKIYKQVQEAPSILGTNI